MAARKKRTTKSIPTIKKEISKEVSIKQVSNGWVVSQWNSQGKQITKIAKTKAEAKKYATAMLGL